MSTPVKVSVTFSGADNRTTIDDVCRICEEADRLGIHVEFGLLCSATRGGTPRYPSPWVARHLAKVATDEHVTVAVHLCGSYARAAVDGTLADVLSDVWATTLCVADRVQVNLPPGMSLPDELRAARLGVARAVQLDPRDMRRPLVIGQHRNANKWHAQEFGVQWLYDPSAGTGAHPSEWPALPSWRVGLAGGLGPGTVAYAARHLAAGAGGWLDMETNIRDADDRLCADLCRQVLREIADAVREARPA